MKALPGVSESRRAARVCGTRLPTGPRPHLSVRSYCHLALVPSPHERCGLMTSGAWGIFHLAAHSQLQEALPCPVLRGAEWRCSRELALHSRAGFETRHCHYPARHRGEGC